MSTCDNLDDRSCHKFVKRLDRLRRIYWPAHPKITSRSMPMTHYFQQWHQYVRCAWLRARSVWLAAVKCDFDLRHTLGYRKLSRHTLRIERSHRQRWTIHSFLCKVEVIIGRQQHGGRAHLTGTDLGQTLASKRMTVWWQIARQSDTVRDSQFDSIKWRYINTEWRRE